MSAVREFTEVGHCGGKLTVTVATEAGGEKKYQLGFTHCSPTPALISTLFASFDGAPLGFIQMGGLSDRPNEAPPAPGISVLLASDMEGMYGHTCPRCEEYWRADGFPATWRTTCPYCGLRMPAHAFLTKGQRKFIKEFCGLVVEAMEGPDGTHEIDMDAVADAVGKDIEKPKFVYAEQTMQNRYNCEACGSAQDILGRYGFCSSCGTRNDLMEVRSALGRIKARVDAGTDLVSCLKDAVTEFDSAGRAFAKRLAAMVPMKPGRKAELDRMLFHNLNRRAEEMKNWFDIDLFKGMSPADVAFVGKMFARRHVYEHNGGEVDQRYIDETGDTTVKPKQLIRESRESILAAIGTIESITANFHAQFHEIFPPDQTPISYHRPKRRK